MYDIKENAEDGRKIVETRKENLVIGENICDKFLEDEILSIRPFGDGHINDTFLVRTQEESYICQHIRKEMNVAALERNFYAYANACKGEKWLFPEWMRTKDGEYYYTDLQGDHWRMYPYLVGDVLEPPLTKEQLFECGKGLARMHGILRGICVKPLAVYPHLHDLAYYYDDYCSLIERKTLLREECRDSDMEEVIRVKIGEYLELPLDRSRIVHGDAKLGNILFREGVVVGFLDLDTIMQGSLLEDVADCIRSCCIVEGRLDEAAAGKLMEGYLQSDERFLSEEEKKLLPKVIGKICFELALRYYTDCISKNPKFRVNFPGYRLEKAWRYMKMC